MRSILDRTTITKDNINIRNSWQFSKREFRVALETIRCEIIITRNPCEVFHHRTMGGLCLEWATHNALYSLGLWKERTGSVDLNYPNKWAWLYCIIGVLVWPFIP